jgi:RNA polymerase sigma factor (sigma-70 family)
MTNESKQVVELTPEVIDYVRTVAHKVARRCLPSFVGYNDAIQHALMHFMHYPPKYDPSRGASLKHFIYLIVQRVVLEYAKKDKERRDTNKELPEPELVLERDISRREAAKRVVGEMMTCIKDKDIRNLCQAVLECDGNMSKAARRLGQSEGNVRYLLKTLGPKLRLQGFDPSLR